MTVWRSRNSARQVQNSSCPFERFQGGRFRAIVRCNMRTWVTKLDDAAKNRRSHVCVGLDPDLDRMPQRDVFRFNKAIVDATNDLVCAYKPQLAFYEALGHEGLLALGQTVEYIKHVAPDVLLIGDAKRNDIGSTAAAYATAMFDRWGFDVVTVNAYLGRDSIEPFVTRPPHGALIVCRTSNIGARDIQDLKVVSQVGTEQRLFQHVADLAESMNDNGNVGLVVGATYPVELRELRRAHPSLPFLIPGVGAQGGDAAEAARLGADTQRRGIIINSSRGIIYASSDPVHFPVAARSATEALRSTINVALGSS